MKCLALALLLFAAAATHAQVVTVINDPKAKNDLEKSGLLGRVKSVEFGRIEYPLKDGRATEGKRNPIQKTDYNEDGNMVEQVTFDRKGFVEERRVLTYDAAGRNTGYDEYSSIVDKSLSKPRRHVYTLDYAGRTLEYDVFDSDGSPASRFIYKYDGKGNKTDEEFYSWNGYRTGKLSYAYDDNGHLLTETSYERDDAVSWQNVNTYDAQGNKAESAQYQHGTLRYKFLYKYDAKGRVREEETMEFNAPSNMHVSHAPEPGKVVTVYDDEKGTKTVTYYDERGVFKNKAAYSTDGRGNDAGVRMFNADGSQKDSEIYWYEEGTLKLQRKLSGTPSIKYEYDSHGNWTRKTYLIQPADSEKPEAYQAEYRDITYY
ncbi:MAG TPA: hypothetical protein VLJ61_14995 [Pyrinomonadaceae bacterium]|nr:hypothetical protein [Pyrinomonadaceae bacterium]